MKLLVDSFSTYSAISSDVISYKRSVNGAASSIIRLVYAPGSESILLGVVYINLNVGVPAILALIEACETAGEAAVYNSSTYGMNANSSNHIIGTVSPRIVFGISR